MFTFTDQFYMQTDAHRSMQLGVVLCALNTVSRSLLALVFTGNHFIYTGADSDKSITTKIKTN